MHVEIAVTRESENPDDCGVKLRGMQTNFCNLCLPVALATKIRSIGGKRSVVLRSGAHKKTCVFETPLTLWSSRPAGVGGCSRDPVS
jgi:hypothetical protein